MNFYARNQTCSSISNSSEYQYYNEAGKLQKTFSFPDQYASPIEVSNNGILLLASNQIVDLKQPTPEIKELPDPVEVSNDPGYSYTNPEGISDDGSTVFGEAVVRDNLGDYKDRPIIWDTQSLDYQYLNMADYDDVELVATNADGSFIVGHGFEQDDQQNLLRSGILLWENSAIDPSVTIDTEAKAAIPADVTPNSNTIFSEHVVVGGVASDGRYEDLAGVHQAFFLTKSLGVTYLADYLTKAGVTVDKNKQSLDAATGVSDDGATIVGYGQSADSSRQVWLARITPLDGAGGSSGSGGIGVIDLSETQQSLYAMGMIAGQMNPALLSGSMGFLKQNCYGQDHKLCAFASGQGASWNDGDMKGSLSRLGAGYKVAPDLYVGVALGHHKADSDHDYGEFDTKGLYTGLWGSYNQNGRGLQAQASLGYVFGDMETKRYYHNGATLETAHGETDYHAYTASARMGIGFAPKENWLLTPFIQGAYVRSNIDGFSETRATFTATYDDQKNDLWQSHMGIEASYQFRPNLRLTGQIAWGHGDAGFSDLTGSIDNTSNLASVEDITIHYDASDWLNLGAGVNWAIKENIDLSFSIEGNIGDDNITAPDISSNFQLQFALQPSTVNL